jgi:tetratricopeptide (TPR) repeat protein
MPPNLRIFITLLAMLVAVSRPGVAADNLGEATIATYPPSYIALIREAMLAFNARDFEAALKLVNKADLTFQVTPVALNVRGAIAIEEKKYDEGREFCLKALNKDPKFYPARFNLCEIQFVQGKYAEARALFQNLRESHPEDDLLKFRIYLTFLLEKKDEIARPYLDNIPQLGTSPYYYYAQAAWEFAHDNPAEGKKWLASGNKIFPPGKHMNFVDVFYDLGWLTRDDASKSAE